MPKRKKLVNIKDIAKEAKCSISSVSFALNEPNRIGANTRRHILRIARELGYSRVKKLKHRGTIGLVSDDYYNLIFGEFYNMVAFGILEELKKRNTNTLIESTGRDPEYFPKMITKSKVDGVLFLGKCSRDIIYIAQQKNIPIVLVGHPIPDIELPAVVPDGRSGAYQATKHLIELGHKKIALISGEPRYDPTVSERIDGYRFALNQSGIIVPEYYIEEADFGKPDSAINATKRLLGLTSPPTAIFCLSDSLAYRAYEAIKSLGLRIPEDISVVGFDDISAPNYALLPQPGLTTIHVDRKMVGTSSVEILFDILSNKKKPALRYSLPVGLVVKKSTAAPKTFQ